MKKLTLSLIAILVSNVCLAATSIDLGTAAGNTPYDRYMSPVKQVLAHLDGQSPSMNRVRQLMSEGRNFRYSFTDPYVAATPEMTAATRSGDCKAKSLWLASQLNDPSVRFVIGRARCTSKVSHAWLMWKSEGRWWILDCTNTSDPIPADRINPGREYIPLYSYAKTGSYRHLATGEALASAGTGVAVASNN